MCICYEEQFIIHFYVLPLKAAVEVDILGMSFLTGIFGDANKRYIDSFLPTVEKINSFESEFQKFSGERLKEKTAEFRKRLSDGDPSTGSGQETLDDILPEAFAAVREAARRALGQRHFDVQLVGGIVLHSGKIAEMRTGEGKTLVATLPLYLNSLFGKGAHLVTPNDYLSRVGAGWMGKIYHMLGVSVGVIAHDISGIYDPSYEDPHPHGDDRLNHFRPVSRREAYEADITYGTNNEFGFDYLRDNLEYEAGKLRQREHNFAIVDEVDSILIDEARTPLIISAPDEESADLYQVFSRLTPQLKEETDYNVDRKLKAVTITEAGIDKIEKLLGIANIYEERGMRFVRHLEQALRAQALFERDRDYVVKDGEVIIVDEFTGRLMPGRRWSEGLHQAIEAREGVKVQQESRTLATITFQNYFRMYGKLAGMTGTAETSAEEFHKVYNLDVVMIPTHRPMVRKDLADFIFQTEAGKLKAVIREIKERHLKGQPILVGTVSISKNERLSKMLEIEGVLHKMLNAKNHEDEALIIAQAGREGAVTIATNMAGRGVDIILGGNPPDERAADTVRGAGGLHVIGTERHEARRIDNQLRGRAGRQGDAGSSQFFVSLEDELMRIFGPDRVKRMMQSFGIPEDQPIEHKMVSKALESAQSKIEGFHFDSRKHVLEYDDVLNKQRDAIYRMRREVLFPQEADTTLRERIWGMIEEEARQVIEFHTSAREGGDWDPKEIFETFRAIADIPDETREKITEIASGDGSNEEKRTSLEEYVLSLLKNQYDAKEAQLGADGMRNVEKVVMLRAIDILWMDHLDQMEHLRDSVRLRAYGQRDPLVEYKNEGVRLFRELQGAIRSQIVGSLYKVGGTVRPAISEKIEERKPDAPSLNITQADIGGARASPIAGKKSSEPEVGRNDPCPCRAKHPDGRPKKYKHCHGK